jgi:hypothetical protein
LIALDGLSQMPLVSDKLAAIDRSTEALELPKTSIRVDLESEV